MMILVVVPKQHDLVTPLVLTVHPFEELPLLPKGRFVLEESEFGTMVPSIHVIDDSSLLLLLPVPLSVAPVGKLINQSHEMNVSIILY
jgi:hypothetical protein